MAIADLPIFSMMRTRLQWHQERQRILADNVANSDTPRFRPRDVIEPKFDPSAPSISIPVLMRTDPGHQASPEGPDSFQRTDSGFQIRPAGNAVNLEEEMIKVSTNQTDFQAVSALYTQSLGLLKIAVGKK